MVCMEQSKSVDKFIMHPSKLLYKFSFLQESDEKKYHRISPLNQVFINEPGKLKKNPAYGDTESLGVCG